MSFDDDDVLDPVGDEEDRDWAEIDVSVEAQGDNAVLVSDGDVEGWVTHSLISDDSDIGKKSRRGDVGTLIIEQFKAEEIGFV